MLKIWPRSRSRSWPDWKRPYCISVDPYCRSEHIKGVSMVLAWLSKVIAEKLPVTLHDLKDIGVIRRDHWSQFSDSWYQFQLYPIFETVKNGFRPKYAFFIFSHCLIMKGSQNWPDLKSPISNFWNLHFMDTVTRIAEISRQSFIQCGYDAVKHKCPSSRRKKSLVTVRDSLGRTPRRSWGLRGTARCRGTGLGAYVEVEGCKHSVQGWTIPESYTKGRVHRGSVRNYRMWLRWPIRFQSSCMLRRLTYRSCRSDEGRYRCPAADATKCGYYLLADI